MTLIYPGGLSDPFLVLYHNGQRMYKSKIIKETLNPKWDDLNWVLCVFDSYCCEYCFIFN